MSKQLTAHPKGKLVSTQDAASVLNKHPKTLDRYRKEGRGPRWYQPEGPGTTVYYLEHEVVEFAIGESQ